MKLKIFICSRFLSRGVRYALAMRSFWALTSKAIHPQEKTIKAMTREDKGGGAQFLLECTPILTFPRRGEGTYKPTQHSFCRLEP